MDDDLNSSAEKSMPTDHTAALSINGQVGSSKHKQPGRNWICSSVSGTKCVALRMCKHLLWRVDWTVVDALAIVLLLHLPYLLLNLQLLRLREDEQCYGNR